MPKKSIDWQLNIEPGIGETTKYCPDCGKLRGISAFPVRVGTNRVTSKYCKVHTSRRNTSNSASNYEAEYQRIKAELTSK